MHYANFFKSEDLDTIDAQYFTENAVSNLMSCKRGHTLTHCSLFGVKQIRFYALALTSPIFESPRAHTQNLISTILAIGKK